MGRIEIGVQGREPIGLIKMIRAEFDELHRHFDATVSVSVDGGETFVGLDALGQHLAADSTTILADDGKVVETSPFRMFADDAGGRLPRGTVRKAPTREEPEQHEIYMSYAWGDPEEEGESREAIVDRLYEALTDRGYRVIREKNELGYRASVSAFMQQLGRGRLVVVVISEKYLRSRYCMVELLEIYEQGGLEDRLFPIVLPDAKLHDPDAHAENVRYWAEEKRRHTERLANIMLMDSDALSAEGSLKRHDFYLKRIVADFDRVITALADWNALPVETLEADNFDRLVTAIEEAVAAETVSPAET